jgi:hypothetical protein
VVVYSSIWDRLQVVLARLLACFVTWLHACLHACFVVAPAGACCAVWLKVASDCARKPLAPACLHTNDAVVHGGSLPSAALLSQNSLCMLAEGTYAVTSAEPVFVYPSHCLCTGVERRRDHVCPTAPRPAQVFGRWHSNCCVRSHWAHRLHGVPGDARHP